MRITKILLGCVTLATLLGCAVTSPAHASTTPVPDVPTQYAGALVASYDGAAIKADWTASPYGSAACKKASSGASVTVASGNLRLWTSGQDNACAVVKTPQHWNTGVFEARVYIPGVSGEIADWPAFWMVAGSPSYSEIDIFEGLKGKYQTSYWYGPSYRSVQGHGTGSAVAASRLPVYTSRPAPGWHTIDLVWAPSWARVYIDGHLFTLLSGSWFHPVPMQMLLDMTEGYCNSGSTGSFCGGPRKSTSLVIQDVRVWKFR